MPVKPVLVSSQYVGGKPALCPLATPPLACNGGGRLLCVPTPRFVTLLAEQTGKRVATVLANQKGAPIIECIEILSRRVSAGQSTRTVTEAIKASTQLEPSPDWEHWLLLGCKDGTIRQISLSLDRLTSASAASVTDCGPFLITGACVFPERIWKVTDAGIRLISLPSPSTATAHNGHTSETTIYVLAEAQGMQMKNYGLYRVKLPGDRHDRDNGATTTDVSELTLQLGQLGGDAHLGDVRKPTKDFASKDTDDRKGLGNLEVSLVKDVSRTRGVIPFAMSVVASLSGSLIVMASPALIHFYYDDADTSDATQVKSLVVPVPKRNNYMTAMTITSNATHMAVGYRSGEIHLFDNMLPLTLQYLTQSKRQHPIKAVVTRKLHWHAHPVACLVFSDNNRFLFSGGEESVLVTWQLDGSTNRPVQVLPRVALGGIAHIVEMEDHASLFCRDNSVQLLKLIDQSRVWKHQGLAMIPRQASQRFPFLRYSSLGTIQIVGPSLAPGYVHWYDTREQRVVESLEIASFNRISRAEPGETPMPLPMITNAVFSLAGDVMVTCECVPTENTCLGFVNSIGRDVGLVTNLRFWAAKAAIDQSYELVASISSPHGSMNRISAIATAPDGKFVCTLSNDEGAFRVWHQLERAMGEKTGLPVVEWVCQYRITTPSGYATCSVEKQAVCFSPDGSVLAIAYGRSVVLWDRKAMSLLASVPHHAGNGKDPVKFVCFLDMDMILMATASSVSLTSPFGSAGPLNVGWTFQLPPDGNAYEVVDIRHLRTSNMVAAVLFCRDSNTSNVILIHAISGERSVFAENIHGKIMSVVPKEANRQRAPCHRFAAAVDSLVLFALTDYGEMLTIHSGATEALDFSDESAANEAANDVPIMPLLATLRDKAVKRKTVIALDAASHHSDKRMKSIGLPNGEDAEIVGDSQLSASCARYFLVRHLRR